MPLVPVGKRLFMKAQTLPPEIDQEVDLSGATPEMMSQEPNAPDQLEEEVDQAEVEEEDGGSASLTKFLFDFMSTKLGYPPRRLQEFKGQFVKEKGSKGQPSRYTITVPDQVYGKESQIPKNTLKNMVSEIESKFGLSFIDYNRSDLKLELTFSSEDESAQAEMDSGPGDILDVVFGKPKGSSREASTIREMIKVNKADLADNLNKLLQK